MITTPNPNALFCIALFVFGVVIVGAALFLREQLRTSLGASRTELKIGERGGLSATPLPLIILLGFLSVAGASYLWAAGYDKKLVEMEIEVKRIDKALDNLKRYDVYYRLAFPADDLPANLDDLATTVYITHERATTPERYEHAKFEPGPGGLQGTIWDVSRDDSIYITVTNKSENKIWKSDPLRVAETPVSLRKRN